MLSSQQESSLTSAGDCFEHYHSSDRVLSHADVLQLQNLAGVYPVTGNFTIGDNNDFVIADTSADNIIITMPLAGNGREIEVMKNANANYVDIVPVGLDLILGATGLRIYNYGTSIRFKAILNGWIII